MIPQIGEVLTLTRPLIGIDEETTGVKPKTSGIVELGLEIIVPGMPVKEYRTLVNPVMAIPAAATAIHGITNEQVKDAPTFKQLAQNLASGLTECDFIGYNVRFDLEQLEEEFKRAGIEWSYKGARIIDGYRLWQLCEGRTLTDATKRWLGGKEATELDVFSPALLPPDQQGPHNALWDIKMSTRVVASQLLQTSLPRDLDALHALQWPGYYDHQGKLRWVKGEVCFNFGEHRDKPLRVIPRGYLAWVKRSDFNETIKAACEGALRGVFPVAPVEDDDASSSDAD